MTVSLSYMRSEKGIVIHRAADDDDGNSKFDAASLLLQGLNQAADTTDKSIDMMDSVGQKMTLLVENINIGAGQRHIIVYAPYWIPNCSLMGVPPISAQVGIVRVPRVFISSWCQKQQQTKRRTPLTFTM